MLVLSRGIGQKIVIGFGPSAITITVADIRCGSVRLGIEAPREVTVIRGEIMNGTTNRTLTERFLEAVQCRLTREQTNVRLLRLAAYLGWRVLREDGRSR